jgi:hypothetical protein
LRERKTGPGVALDAVKFAFVANAIRPEKIRRAFRQRDHECGPKARAPTSVDCAVTNHARLAEL